MTIQSGKVRTCRLFTEHQRDYEFVVIQPKKTHFVSISVIIRVYPESYVYSKEVDSLIMKCSKNAEKLLYPERRKIRLLVERDISKHFRSKAYRSRLSWNSVRCPIIFFTGSMLGGSFLRRKK